MTSVVSKTRGATSRRPSVARRRATAPGVAKQHGVAWLFVAPFLILFVVLTAIPVLGALGMSFTDITAADIRNPFSVDFVGFSNFVNVLTNATFLRSVANTALFVVVCVPLSMGIGFALAVILNTGIARLRTFFRAAIYLPVITNIVAAAVIWQYAFTINGPVNSGLATLGITGPNWLGDPSWAPPTVIILGVWRNIGTCMVLFLAGLQAVPEEVYEAASIDGAGHWRRLTNMTMPLLRPTTLLVSVLMTVSFLNIFDEPYLLTKGGPLGSTESIALWVYEQFGFGNVAASMAGSFILLILVAVVAVVQFRLLRPKQ
jgi:multiple sugar transport system permease protein